MKDATGELSMTAVAVVAIAAIATILTVLIMPRIRATILRNTYCSQSYGCDCTEGERLCNCWYLEEKDDGTTEEKPIQCPNEANRQ